MRVPPPWDRDTRRQAATWAAAGLAVYLVLVGPILARYDGRAQWFLHLGGNFPPAITLARQVLGPDVLVPHADGHDGRASWVLARDPLLLDGQQTARVLDRPAYRSQRIAYSAIAAPWRLAGEEALVWGLLVTNLVVVGLGGYWAALLARQLRAPPRAALAFILAPATVVAVLGNLGDALGLAALLLAILLHLRRHTALAPIAGTLSVLAREAGLLALLAVAVMDRSRPLRARLQLVVAPAAAFGAWTLYSRWRLGWPPTSIEEFELPFWGWVGAYRRGWRPVGNWADAVVAVGLVPFAVAIVVRWWRRRSLLLTAALPYALMVPFLSAQVLNIAVNSLRAFGPALCLLWMDWYAPDPRSSATPAPPSPAARPASRR